MSHASNTSALASVALLALVLVLPAAPSRAQSAKWDQTRVTALAVQLSDVAAELQTAFRREPPQSIGAQARARASFLDSLRVFRTETRSLAAELEAGAGLDETWPIARRLRVVIRDLREEGRRISLKEPSLGHARRAEELIAQLKPFYFDAGTSPDDASEGATEGAPPR